eukprot:17506-Heterococcus_DN1.PRE.4
MPVLAATPSYNFLYNCCNVLTEPAVTLCTTTAMCQLSESVHYPVHISLGKADVGAAVWTTNGVAAKR